MKNKKVYNGLSFCNLKYDNEIGALLVPDESKPNIV